MNTYEDIENFVKTNNLTEELPANWEVWTLEEKIDYLESSYN